MPSQLLLEMLLPEIELLSEVTDIPAQGNSPPEFVAPNPSRVHPSALRVIALPDPPASTTGRPVPLSTPRSVSVLFTSTFS